MTNKINGFILAGGASSRLGKDKAFLTLEGKTFIERAAAALRTVAGSRIFVVGNSMNTQTERQTVDDEFQAINGKRRAAIIGLHAALRNSKSLWSAILACDLPFVSGKLFDRFAALIEEDFDAIVPIQPDGKRQPLCALYKTAACLPRIEKILQSSDDWSLRNLLKQINARFVDFDEIADIPGAETFFYNVNTPKDYETAKKMFSENKI